jgi:hypothetical protein
VASPYIASVGNALRTDIEPVRIDRLADCARCVRSRPAVLERVLRRSCTRTVVADQIRRRKLLKMAPGVSRARVGLKPAVTLFITSRKMSDVEGDAVPDVRRGLRSAAWRETDPRLHGRVAGVGPQVLEFATLQEYQIEVLILEAALEPRERIVQVTKALIDEDEIARRELLLRVPARELIEDRPRLLGPPRPTVGQPRWALAIESLPPTSTAFSNHRVASSKRRSAK